MVEFTYFAYGSNMLTRRLAERTPSARVLAAGVLSRHRLGFSKIGRDGSGKCHLVATDDPMDRVHGILFAIAHSDRPALDAAEPGYAPTTVLVESTVGEAQPALTYMSDAVRPGLRPFDWYKAIVVAGAAEHGLPLAYLEWLRGVADQPDPDAARLERHRRLLGALEC